MLTAISLFTNAINKCVILKYKNKTYSSADLPIFLYFKNPRDKNEFINNLIGYTKPNEFMRVECVYFALAGNTVIKDKRSGLFINLETMEEKRYIQRYLYDSADDSNAVISTPPDINLTILEDWIEKLTKNLI